MRRRRGFARLAAEACISHRVVARAEVVRSKLRGDKLEVVLCRQNVAQGAGEVGFAHVDGAEEAYLIYLSVDPPSPGIDAARQL